MTTWRCSSWRTVRPVTPEAHRLPALTRRTAGQHASTHEFKMLDTTLTTACLLLGLWTAADSGMEGCTAVWCRFMDYSTSVVQYRCCSTGSECHFSQVQTSQMGCHRTMNVKNCRMDDNASHDWKNPDDLGPSPQQNRRAVCNLPTDDHALRGGAKAKPAHARPPQQQTGCATLTPQLHVHCSCDSCSPLPHWTRLLSFKPKTCKGTIHTSASWRCSSVTARCNCSFAGVCNT